MTREASIAAAIDAELRDAGAWTMNAHGTAFGRTGIPDRLACVRGVFLAVEIKAPGGRVSAVQRWELRQIERAGGVAIVARSRADVRDALRAIDERVGGHREAEQKPSRRPTPGYSADAGEPNRKGVE